MAATIQGSDAPVPAGLTFRLIRGAEDAEALRAVHVGRMECDGVDPLSLLDDYPSLDYLTTSLSQAVVEKCQDH